MPQRPPQYLHLDRRAHQIIALSEGRPADELLSDQQVADLFGVGPQWPAQARIGGYGPPFIRLGPKRIRYRRDQINAWLLERSATSTAAIPAWNRGLRKANANGAVGNGAAANGAERSLAQGTQQPRFERGNAAPAPKPNRYTRGN